MKLAASTLLAALLSVSSFSFAHALPGEKFAAVKTRALHAAFALKCRIGEMSGAPFCTQKGTYLGASFNRTFSDDAGHIVYQEMLWYNRDGFRFLTRNDPRVRGLLTTIYDANVVQDFLDAKVAATVPVYQSTKHATFLRGRHFGYVTGGDGGFSLTLFRVSDLNAEIQSARKCATMECGD